MVIIKLCPRVLLGSSLLLPIWVLKLQTLDGLDLFCLMVLE